MERLRRSRSTGIYSESVPPQAVCGGTDSLYPIQVALPAAVPDCGTSGGALHAAA